MVGYFQQSQLLFNKYMQRKDTPLLPIGQLQLRSIQWHPISPQAHHTNIFRQGFEPLQCQQRKSWVSNTSVSIICNESRILESCGILELMVSFKCLEGACLCETGEACCAEHKALKCARLDSCKELEGTSRQVRLGKGPQGWVQLHYFWYNLVSPTIWSCATI